MKKILFLFIAIVSCTAILAQNSVNLKLNPEKNKIYRFGSSSEQTIIQTINGNQQVVESKNTYAVSIKMIDITSDFMINEVHFDTLITKSNSMGKTTNYSSVNEGDIKSSETSEILSFIMNRLSKNTVYAKMDFAGKVLEIVNAKMLSDIILKDTIALTVTGPVGAAIRGQIKNLISENTLKTLIEVYTHNLPGKEVSRGDKWNNSLETNSGGMSLSINTEYNLAGVTGNVAEITADSEIKTASGAGPIMSGGATITYDDLKGMSKSSMTIDSRTGYLIEVKGKSHITGNLGVSAPGMSMQIPMDINTTSRVIAYQ